MRQFLDEMQLVNAIRSPFGDHWAERAAIPEGVTRRRPLPSAFTTNSPVLRLDWSNAANATREPSGAQSAPTRSKKSRSMIDSPGGLSWTGSLASGFTENRVPWPLANWAYRIREPSGE